jgi:hypothetical protein
MCPIHAPSQTQKDLKILQVCNANLPQALKNNTGRYDSVITWTIDHRVIPGDRSRAYFRRKWLASPLT